MGAPLYREIATQHTTTMRDLDIKSTGEVDNDILYHSMLEFSLIDLVIIEISRREVCFLSLLEGGCPENTLGVCEAHQCGFR